MISKPPLNYRTFYASIFVGMEFPQDYPRPVPFDPRPEVWEVYEAIRMLFVHSGFRFHQDPQIKKQYRTLAQYHHHAQRGDLQCAAEVYCAGMRFEFYQDGGRYDYDKIKKMPYLIRLRFQWMRARICKLLDERGFACTDEPVCATAYDWVQRERAKLCEFQGADFYDEKRRYSYNILDADNAELRDGEVRYFYDYYGHLGRGRVYHHINNMWWVVVNRDCHLNLANFNLFAWRPGLPRREPHSNPRKCLESELEKAVKAQNFERAIVLRELLKKLVAGKAT